VDSCVSQSCLEAMVNNSKAIPSIVGYSMARNFMLSEIR